MVIVLAWEEYKISDLQIIKSTEYPAVRFKKESTDQRTDAHAVR